MSTLDPQIPDLWEGKHDGDPLLWEGAEIRWNRHRPVPVYRALLDRDDSWAVTSVTLDDLAHRVRYHRAAASHPQETYGFVGPIVGTEPMKTEPAPAPVRPARPVEEPSEIIRRRNR